MCVITVKTSMSRSIWIIASILVGAASAPAAASSTSVEDPGAFATLGSVYFSSILEQAGIGSGGSGKSGGSASGASGRDMTAAGSSGLRAGGAIASLPGGAGSGGGPGGPGDYQPGGPDGNGPDGNGPGGDGPTGNNPGGDPYTEIFKDPPPGTVPGGSDPANGDGSTNPPSNNPPGTPWPTATLPDDVLGDQGGLTMPPVATIAPAASIVQVPEPASLAMFGAGLLLVGLIARRRT